MTNLTKYDVALIGVRLLALSVILQIISILPTWLWSLAVAFKQNPAENTTPVILQLLAIGLLLLTLLTPVILWTLSQRIARYMTSSTDLIGNKEKENISIKDLQTMLFCAVGLFVFVTTAPTFIVLIYDYIHAYMKSTTFASRGTSLPQLISLSLKMILSLFLIFSAQGLSNILNKLRYAGLKK